MDMNDPGTAGFDTGFDWATGYGLIRADAAVQSVLAPGTISGIAFRDGNADGVAGPGEPPVSGVTVFLDANDNGVLDAGETSTTTLADGSYSFDVEPGNYFVRQVAPAETLATDTGPYSAVVSSGSAVNGPDFGEFPIVYTGSASADVYSVRIDPNDSSRIQISETLGGDPTTNYSIEQSRITTLTFNSGAGDDSMTLNGALAVNVIFNGGTDCDTLIIDGGAHTFASDLQTGSADLSLNVIAGSVEFGSTQHLGDLTIADGASAVMAANGNWYLQITGLSLTGSATLDLNDNDLVVQYTGASPFTQLQQWVMSGYAAAGSPGIGSTVAENTGQQTFLALLDNADFGASEWPEGSGNMVGPMTIIGKYTYFGDTNLDGMVTAADYNAVDAGLGRTGLDPGEAWAAGDTNFDYNITAADYNAIDAGLGLGVGNPL
jgi:hypothetical protein